MFISRVPLNGARRAALEVMTSPNKMHGAVEAAFAPVPDCDFLSACQSGQDFAEGRILWRIDRAPDGGRGAWLYVVSPKRPDFTHLCEQMGWPVEGGWETKDYEPFLKKIGEGQRWQFRLKANPVRKVFVDKSSRSDKDVIGTIQGHVTVEQQMQWLLDRAEAHGFRILEDPLGNLQFQVGQREKSSFSHAGSRATLTTAVFDGALEVIDREALCHVLRFGMGRAKAYGCGLMTLAPLS